MAAEIEPALAALADRTRRVLLQRLGQGPATTGQLAELLPISRPAVSQHLKVLQEAKLVETTTVGRQRWHELRAAPLRQVERWAAALADRAMASPRLPAPLSGRAPR